MLMEGTFLGNLPIGREGPSQDCKHSYRSIDATGFEMLWENMLAKEI